MIEYSLVTKIRFHIKAIPWFISDINLTDFDWTINTLSQHSDPLFSSFGQQISEHIKTGRFEIIPVNYFWTGPYEFYRMESVEPNLYAQLKESLLVIFKGDLNYRKLLGDFNWPYGSSFKEVLRGMSFCLIIVDNIYLQ